MERKIKLTNRVYLSELHDYEYENVKPVIYDLLEKVCLDNGWEKDFFDGKKVTVKPNLLSRADADKCITSHPSFVKAACEYFSGLGAHVTVADSPGGTYNHASFSAVVRETGVLDAAQDGGAQVNDDYGFELMSNHDVSKFNFNIINPLVNADVVVNLNRLKTHALCEMTAAVKNMFGSIPGLQKAEQHARFPSRISFADMLCDLCLITAPCVNITDAVVCMEGNGPSGGTLKKVGCVTASANPFAADVLNSYIMGYKPEEVGTVECAVKRGLCPENTGGLEIIGCEKEKFASDFVRPDSRAGGIVKQIPSIFGGGLRTALEPRPTVKKNLCVGCGICARNCPVEAITIKDKKAHINNKKCIKCYCCQEFCPQKAVKAKPLLGIFTR